MKIVVVEPDGGGGLIHYAYQLCTALADEGADVTLITSRHYELEALPHRFAVDTRMRLWANVVPGKRDVTNPVARRAVAMGRAARRIARGLRYVWEWERLTRHLLRIRPDVVQFGVIRFGFLTHFLRRMRRGDLVLTQICHEFVERDRTPGRIDIPAVFGNFSAIFLHGEANRTAFLEQFPVLAARCVAIPHGNEAMLTRASDRGGDLRRRYGIAPDRPVALFFGGLRPSKGLEDLIDAFALVLREIEATLVIAGPPQGVGSRDLIDRAERLGIARDVVVDAEYLPLADVGPLLRTGDVVVLPYRSASASGVLQAAYAFARPVIVTEAGALPEAVDPGVTGFTVPTHRSDLLARAMVKVLSDRAEARRMGDAARRMSERDYAWGPIARTVLRSSREASEETER
jgi:glycosyltransferase involved in cell wall biosynthesis